MVYHKFIMVDICCAVNHVILRESPIGVFFWVGGFIELLLQGSQTINPSWVSSILNQIKIIGWGHL